MNDLPDTARPRLATKVRLKWDEVRQKPLLLFPEGVLVLNPTAHEIVGLCDGQRTVAEIVKTLGEKFAERHHRPGREGAAGETGWQKLRGD
jgi:coenzyme PQQ biosynthesis protein PqqD